MKAFNRILSAVAVAVILLFVVVNMVLAADKTDGGRLYRVEISRLVRELEANGSADISECEYVTNIERYGENFYSTDSDYVICEINGELYRFDYNTNGYSNKTCLTGIVNAALGVMAILLIVVMLYIKFAILAPFERLSDIPYELSKSNLTAPITETKNRFFGKFLWGIDILRENIEQQKQRELEMQKEKKTLLLSLSHDIKTPLSAIKLYSAALSKNLYSDTEKQRKIAENINEKADEIEGYVSQIITASREDFLSLEVNMGEFYLSELIEKITGYYREKLALIKTDFIIGEYKNCLLLGDLNRSVEVLQNVIENSLKYGDGRRVELIFPEDDECAQIAIINGGCTLGKDDLPHIFESFWRGANAKNLRGSGLGLYICRQLMCRMNGEIFAKIDDDIITVTAVFARV
ncbi:MAG: HAMP domain-containing histidine kinase [Lachnospiraceae bacterium]|nr:HAMP domain-containing histidine kinase [Lachnospiraceae bacterium]